MHSSSASVSGGGGGGGKRCDPYGLHREALQVAEIVRNRLYFVTYPTAKARRNTQDVHYFNIDQDLVYNNFFSDFGPVSVGCLFKYCVLLASKLKSPAIAKKVIVHYTSMDQRKRANAAFLISAFSVVYLHDAPKDINRQMLSAKHPYMAFQDATIGPSPYRLRIVDCLNAVEKAFAFNFINFNDFDLAEYEYYERLENGDLNWILPKKFLAFSGPTDLPTCYYHTPEFYVNYFLTHNVTTVVRLNKQTYEPQRFTKVGITHHDLYFVDGTTPTNEIMNDFLNICENAPGAIAVHCKAGLGRTGTLIATYLMKHYRMTALEAIAWIRICRPGSIIGLQQSWLESMESMLWRLGHAHRLRHNGNGDRIMVCCEGIYSVRNKNTCVEGPNRAPVAAQQINEIDFSTYRDYKAPSPVASSHEGRALSDELARASRTSSKTSRQEEQAGGNTGQLQQSALKTQSSAHSGKLKPKVSSSGNRQTGESCRDQPAQVKTSAATCFISKASSHQTQGDQLYHAKLRHNNNNKKLKH